MKITPISGGVCAPQGFNAAGIHSGIAKNPDKKDLALIVSETRCPAAAVYTKNKVQASPIAVDREHLKDSMAQAIIVNSGNANCCNADGYEVAKTMCRLAAGALAIDAADVLVCSTGVIGQSLPIAPIANTISTLAESLSAEGAADAAQAIMTTDLLQKEAAVSFEIGGVPCQIGATAKGSGMIHPNMGTMLAFITTDAAIAAPMLRQALTLVVNDTFNMVSVDGDTSTNDTAIILANGRAGNPAISGEGAAFDAFVEALKVVCTRLARMMAKDGEGATKLLECMVTGAPDEITARALAKSVITSSLLKAAMFGADANWGRVLCALGYADAQFDIAKTEVIFASKAGEILVCQNGAGVPFSEEKAKEILVEDEIQIQVNLYQGGAVATAWGCDLTYDYVKINGDYRS